MRKKLTLLNGAIDFKWNKKDGIKILEIQSAFRSGSKGFDTLPENTEFPMMQRIYRYMKFLSDQYQYSLFIQRECLEKINRRSGDVEIEKDCTIIEEDKLVTVSQEKNGIILISEDGEQDGIMFFRPENQWPQFYNIVACCRAQYNQNVVVASGNSTTQALFENKVVTDYLCKQYIPEYYPYSVTLFLNDGDQPNWMKKIDDASEKFMNHDYVVIKPTNEFQGRGVLIVPSAQLHDVLLFIAGKSAQLDWYPTALRKTKAALDYWREFNPKDHYIILQELIRSDALSIKQEGHKATSWVEPTYRIFFTVVDEELVIHGCYAKLAPVPLEGSLIHADNFVSEIPSDDADRERAYPSSMAVDAETFEKMKHQFKVFFPNFCRTLLALEFNDVFAKQIQLDPSCVNHLITEIGCYSLGTLPDALLNTLTQYYRQYSDMQQCIFYLFNYHFFNHCDDFTPALFDFFKQCLKNDLLKIYAILNMKNFVLHSNSNVANPVSIQQKEYIEQLAILARQALVRYFLQSMVDEDATFLFKELVFLLEDRKTQPDRSFLYGATKNDIRSLVALRDRSEKRIPKGTLDNLEYSFCPLITAEEAVHLYAFKM